MANDILVKVGADITDFSRKMTESSNALSNFTKANKQTFDAFKQTGAMITGAGVALAGGLGIAVKTASDFESSMSQVKAISGATGEDFDSLKSKAIEMGNSTMFSASQSADAMGNLAQMGWETNDILDGIEHTLNLAAAGGLELADAAMITANTMNQFGLEASEAERIADVLALTASSAGTNVIEMGDAMQYAGANAAAAGMSVEDTAAFIGILGDAGITGSKAGTSLNAMLRDLKKNSEDGSVAVGDHTIALYDAEGKMRDLPSVISELIKATSTMSDEQRDAALSTILGDQALVGFNAIASKGADSVADLAKELYDSKGAASDMAAVMQDNLNGALTELGSAFEGVQIAIGSALIPIIRKAAEGLTKLADWFNGLSDRMKSFIAIGAAVAAGLALIVGPILLLVGFIPSIVSGFAALKVVIAGIGKAVAGISWPITIAVALIVALAAVIIKYWTPIKTFFVNLWKSVVDAFKSGFATIDNATNGWLSNTIGVYKAWGNTVTDVFKRSWQAIKDSFSNALDFLKALVKLDFSGMKDAIQSQMETVKTYLSEVWTIIKDNMASPLKSLGDSVRETFSNLKDGTVEKLQELGTAIIEWFTSMPQNIRETLTEWGTSIGEWFTSMRETLTEKLTGWGESISEWFSTMPETIVTLLETWRDAIVTWTEEQNELNKQKFGEWGEAISEWFTSIPSMISEKLVGWGEAIATKFTEIKDTIVEKISEWGTAIFKWFGEQPSKISESLTKWWSAFSKWLSEIPSRITEKLKSWWEAFRTWFTELPKKSEVKNAGRDMIDKVAEGTDEKRDDFVSKLGRLIIDVAGAALSFAVVALVAAGRELIERIIEGINNMRESLRGKALELMQNFAQTIQSVNLVEVGKNVINGLVRGMSQVAHNVWNKAKEIATGVIERIKNVFRTASPSKVTTQIGGWVGQGLAEGLTDSIRQVSRASDMLSKAAMPDVPAIDLTYATPGGIRSSLSSAVSGTVDVNSRDSALIGAISSLERRLTGLEVVMDGQTVGRIVEPHVSAERDERILRRNRARGY